MGLEIIVAASLIFGIIACLIPVFVLDSTEEYKRTLRILIRLLIHKGYNPKQICSILNLYD